MLDRLFALEAFGIKLGLENITRLCAALGHPERAFHSLHVAGTNGKGSVTAMAHAALRAAGVRAGRYTSPHLTRLAERFVIDDSPVDDDTLASVVGDVLACVDRLRADGTLSVAPTFFEATTATAFELFRRAGVQVAVIEVGLGGRFDATNVITPVACAITTIDLDHQQHLGSTIEQIAFEKAGIIKPGVPVVTGALPAAAQAVVSAIARERGAPLTIAAADAVLRTATNDGRISWELTTPRAHYGPLPLALRGEHQAANALVAVRLLEAAAHAGVAPAARAIEQGLVTVEWPARLELFELITGGRVLLDVAHNGEGAVALAQYLRRWHPDRPPLVLGVMRDKDIDQILRALLPVTSHVIATAAPTPRAMTATELAARVTASGYPDVEVVAEPMAAVERGLAAADTVCVAGSVFLAGPVRDGLKARARLRNSPVES